ncbi:MAG TPA: cellulase family glycosylhydrolase, partial [Nocardioidaceae bacterium]|nr:cellulase family glycosylhydrolase [Nocardioidaceae bacterium]
MRSKIVWSACLALLLAGLAVPSASSAPADSVPQHLRHTGQWFADEHGKVVVIHGTNMINKLAPYTPDALGFGDEDLRFLADNGFNGIRLGLTWAAVEPSPGQYDDAYIDKIIALAAKATAYGMLPVVNFHQDGYSEVYGGNGAPAWASLSYGVPGSPLPAPANVLPGAAIANENFWANAKAPDGVGLQDHYAAAWQHVAARFDDDSHTVFELINEPSPGYVDVAPCALPIGCPLFDQGKLAPFYDKVLGAVREVDADRLVFVEPSAFFGLGARTWLPASGDPQVGFAFHNYCALALVQLPLAVPTLPCDVLTSLNQANAQAQFDATGEPLLMNEFGAGDTDAVVSGVVDRADQAMLSWMHWAYWAQDFGHPATYGL